MFQRCKSLCLNIQLRYKSVLSKAEAKERRNLLFEEEKKRQRNAIGRIEKIEVKYQSPVEEITLIMNKHISTPADCAKHISEGVTKVSALALVDANWDPTSQEMRALSAQYVKLINKELDIERIETTESVAHIMFLDNPIKLEQIPNIAKCNNNKIILYRMGDHVDISKGPMISRCSTSQRSYVESICVRYIGEARENS
ncbi:39S ribosomal protein L39, mitochondrial [Anthophora quadrimaculata]